MFWSFASQYEAADFTAKTFLPVDNLLILEMERTIAWFCLEKCMQYENTKFDDKLLLEQAWPFCLNVSCLCPAQVS